MTWSRKAASIVRGYEGEIVERGEFLIPKYQSGSDVRGAWPV
jgi:hypothetical protein